MPGTWSIRPRGTTPQSWASCSRASGRMPTSSTLPASIRSRTSPSKRCSTCSCRTRRNPRTRPMRRIRTANRTTVARGTATRAMKAMKNAAARTTMENPVAMAKTRKTERTRAAVAATGNPMTPTAKKAKGKDPVKARPTVPAKEMARRAKPTRPSSRCSTRTAPLPT